MEAYIRSLEHLETYLDRFDEIWPSHAELHVPPESVRQLHDGAQAVLKGEIPGTAAEMFGTPITEYDLGFCVLLCDR